jgi:hypothetical protein
VLELAKHSSQKRRVLNDAGLAITLKHISGWSSSAVSMSPGSWSNIHHSAAMEDSKEVLEQARIALDWLEHGDVYSV